MNIRKSKQTYTNMRWKEETEGGDGRRSKDTNREKEEKKIEIEKGKVKKAEGKEEMKKTERKFGDLSGLIPDHSV